jgi:hypothetical protein
MRDAAIALLDHQAFDPAQPEIGGEAEADGTAADDQDLNVQDLSVQDLRVSVIRHCLFSIEPC